MNFPVSKKKRKEFSQSNLLEFSLQTNGVRSVPSSTTNVTSNETQKTRINLNKIPTNTCSFLLQILVSYTDDVTHATIIQL